MSTGEHEPVTWRYVAEREQLELAQDAAGLTLVITLSRREVALLDRFIREHGLHGLSDGGSTAIAELK